MLEKSARRAREKPSRAVGENYTSEASILTKVRRTCLCLKSVGRLNGRNTGKDVGATGWQATLLVVAESEESRRWR